MADEGVGDQALPGLGTEPPAFDASLADHGLEARIDRYLVYPLGEKAPAPGEVFPILPGIGWLRLPVPGPLRHINIWLLDDGEPGQSDPPYAICDTGLAIREAREAWDTIFAGPLAGRAVSRVIVTHFHPDHVGNAGMLCERQRVRLWMNRTEWLMARMLSADRRALPPAEAIDEMRAAGWDEDRLEKFRARGWGNFARAVSPVPVGHVRLVDGETLVTGARSWRIITGGGHTPEHVSFYDAAARILIAGDQLLPRITSNVSLHVSEPESDPLGEWLDSLARLAAIIHPDTLVLPAHGEPFTGAHARIEAIAEGHRDRLDDLHQALRRQPMRGVDCFGLLFARPIDDSVYGLATGEAMAHLRHLERTGKARRRNVDGVDWYEAA